METSGRGDREGALNDSWVELHYSQNGSGRTSGQLSPDVMRGVKPLVLPKDSMEKLLQEAQRESPRSTSREDSSTSASTSSHGSPKSPASSDNGTKAAIKEGQISDWIWDWSSRPEALPPSDYGKFVHPKRSRLSVRNTRVMKARIFSLENLPTLLLTHATTFFLGAAVMFMCLKKYAHWAAVSAE